MTVNELAQALSARNPYIGVKEKRPFIILDDETSSTGRRFLSKRKQADGVWAFVAGEEATARTTGTTAVNPLAGLNQDQITQALLALIAGKK